MEKYIKQFMWGFQHHFRRGLEYAARDAFARIKYELELRAYLVGFTDDPESEFAVCFESETDALAGVDLTDIPVRAQERYESHPDRNMIISSARHHERRQRELFDRCRAQALSEALESDPLGADMHFFVGPSATVNSYEVHPIIGVPRARWESRVALRTSEMDRYRVHQSFQDAVMHELLIRATTDLSGREAPEEYAAHFSDRSELIREAGRKFVQSTSLVAGQEFGSQLSFALDEISAQPYEGRAGSGGVLLARKSDPMVEMLVSFQEPVSVTQTRAFRKLLEMARADCHLLCDQDELHGLARLSPAYDPTTESVVKFEVVGRSAWEMSHDAVALLRVDNTRPTVPRPRLDAEGFVDTVSRLFPECRTEDLDRLWKQAEECANEAKHGTMLVVHRNAAQEAERLIPQSQRIVPTNLGADLLNAVTSIDGALLVDPMGDCHAIGVILDGQATGAGDSSRGARFNSAMRYEYAQRGQCLVIVISEDGMIDLHPNLRRRVRRSELESVVKLVEDAATSDSPDYEVFFRAWHRAEELAFYFGEDSCRRLNAARHVLESHRRSTSLMQVSWSKFSASQEMDNSYLLDS